MSYVSLGSAEYNNIGQLGPVQEAEAGHYMTSSDSGHGSAAGGYVAVRVMLPGKVKDGNGQSHYATMTKPESETPPPLPPRFATIRKSYTLPHNMAGAAESRIYDNPSNLRRETPTSVSSQNSSQIYASNHINQGSLPKKSGQTGTAPNNIKQMIRPRPSSLSVEKRQFLRSASQDNSNRPISSMSTFSVTTPGTPQSANMMVTQATPSKRSRSLQRGGPGQVARHSRSVSSDDGDRQCIRHVSQLSHSTPQDLDTNLATSYKNVSRGKTWRSNDGLITPISFDGGSPYHTPGDSPADSPQIVAKFHPRFFTRVPLKVSGTTGVAGARRRGLQTGESVISLNNPSPHRERDLATGTKSERCGSMPRSCTTDVLYRYSQPPRQESKRYSAALIFNSKLSNIRNIAMGEQERVKETSPLGNSRSLENIIRQAKMEHELQSDRKNCNISNKVTANNLPNPDCDLDILDSF